MKLRAAGFSVLIVVVVLAADAVGAASAAGKEGSRPAAQAQDRPFEISINWRTRAEGWNWFQGPTGNSDYPLWDSLLRIGIGQTRERIDWFAEMEQPSILGLPNDAVVAPPQGQLGLEGRTTRPTSTRRTMPACS